MILCRSNRLLIRTNEYATRFTHPERVLLLMYNVDEPFLWLWTLSTLGVATEGSTEGNTQEIR
jgi:hypothetical protein